MRARALALLLVDSNDDGKVRAMMNVSDIDHSGMLVEIAKARQQIVETAPYWSRWALTLQTFAAAVSERVRIDSRSTHG